MPTHKQIALSTHATLSTYAHTPTYCIIHLRCDTRMAPTHLSALLMMERTLCLCYLCCVWIFVKGHYTVVLDVFESEGDKVRNVFYANCQKVYREGLVTFEGWVWG